MERGEGVFVTRAKTWPPERGFMVLETGADGLEDIGTIAHTVDDARGFVKEARMWGRKARFLEYRLVKPRNVAKKAKRKSGIVKPKPAAIVDGIPMFVGDRLFDSSTGKMRRVTKQWPGKPKKRAAKKEAKR